jgi:transcriptional regulator with XRE-family HTH domain
MAAMPALSLVGKTRLMMRRSELTQREMAEGSGVGYEWLRQFWRNSFADYGVRKVQRLHDFLEAEEARTAAATAAHGTTSTKTETASTTGATA